ncbi:MAG: YpmS family protein [Limosilactobacillus sp.]|uniref:YpmS family protein n=1 Tax=Limosilactobacillus sp. TaxID=2773925 RepID=UPI002A74FD48|nr:YpmS family protein [Limosilactobacillus sp.]MDD7693157.1 YpmS family protein [Lactobacillaceae bacterium]MDY2802767.1 YpmS family protein [Limosilactobacillus sp.]
MNKTAKKSFNGWKWAFFVLLAAIIIGGAVVVHKAAAPAPAPEVSRPVQATDTSLTVALNRKQVNALSANYLNQFLKGERVKYHFIVGVKYATLIGDTKFMGVKIRFAINFIPQMTKEGNILLKAKGLSVGQLNIPLKFVMGYIAKNYNIPKWVSIDAKNKTILLDLNRYSKHRSLKYSAEEINMEDGRFRFLITVPTNN